MNKNIKQTIFLISIIALLLLFLWFSGYQCPLLFFFGIPCPFCGMTRAFLCLLSGDLTTAFYYHPLWPVVLGIFIIFPLWKFRLLHLSDKWIDHGAFAIGILFLLCFIIRHVTHSPIVQIDFTKGIFHFFSYMIYEKGAVIEPLFSMLLCNRFIRFLNQNRIWCNAHT